MNAYFNSHLDIPANFENLSPYEIDREVTQSSDQIGSIFFDGVFKGDYSLAIVNRYLADAFARREADLTLFSTEAEVAEDGYIARMDSIKSKFIPEYPVFGAYDIHIRNTWPPRMDDMIGASNERLCLFRLGGRAGSRMVSERYKRSS